MKENAKFILQTLVIPAVLAYFGYRINSTLQDKQREFDKIKFTDQVLNEAFDANNAGKAFALSKLIPQLIDDKAFADTLIELIKNHYLTVASNALQVGDDTVYRQISDAARMYQVHSFTDSLTKNPLTSRAEEAHLYENKGLELIEHGDLKEAQKNFEKAEHVYPGFHSAYEISNLLKNKTEQLKIDKDTARAKQEMIQAVRKNYSWKLPLQKARVLQHN
jgi:tetratricopeptide (TPR) repeat protein